MLGNLVMAAFAVVTMAGILAADRFLVRRRISVDDVAEIEAILQRMQEAPRALAEAIQAERDRLEIVYAKQDAALDAVKAQLRAIEASRAVPPAST